MTERYRAENERSTWMRFHTQTAGVSLTAQQPLNNLTRVAIQALAAVLGGTQSLHTDAYDEAWAVPSAEAALLALRQQQIIAAETGVANTVDPLGGSWFVESLTNEVERAGVALPRRDRPPRRHGRRDQQGYPQQEIADAAYRFQRELDEGEREIVGVNRWRGPRRGADDPAARGVRGVAARAPGATGADAARARAARRVAAALAGLRDAASRPGLVRDERDARTSSSARRPTRRSASCAASCAPSSASTASRSRSELTARVLVEVAAATSRDRSRALWPGVCSSRSHRARAAG